MSNSFLKFSNKCIVLKGMIFTFQNLVKWKYEVVKNRRTAASKSYANTARV